MTEQERRTWSGERDEAEEFWAGDTCPWCDEAKNRVERDENGRTVTVCSACGRYYEDAE